MSEQAPRRKQRPRDVNQLAKAVVVAPVEVPQSKFGDDLVNDPAAMDLGRRGELRGGRAESMTAERRSELASIAPRKELERE